MLAKREIETSLRALDVRFRAAKTQREAQFFAKLAILELAGWTEEAIDDCVLRLSRRRLREPSNVNYVTKSIVRTTHGFDYKQHVRRMLCQVIGLVNVEVLERKVDQQVRAQFAGALSQLKAARDPVAHTHIRGTTPRLDAPSLVRVHFAHIRGGLMEIERVLRKLGF